MEKALEMGKVSASGGLQLFVGISTSTAITAIGTIILGWLLLPEEYGLYSVSLIPSLMIHLFRDWGVNFAMTKYIAHFRATKEDEKIRNLVVAGLIFEISTGLALSFLSVFIASFIAVSFFHRPELTSLISLVSITVFSGSLLTVSQSCFVGFEKMGLSSVTMICQAILRSVVSLLLVLFGYGVLGAVLGYALSSLASGLIGLTMLYFILFRPLKRTKRQFQIFKTLKGMLHYGIPLSIGSILGGFTIQFYGSVMAVFCSDNMIGNYQMAVNFAVIPSFFALPISTVLFPAFAKLDSKNESQLLRTVFGSSVKYTAMLLVPATMAMMVLSQPIIGSLFGEKWAYAPLFLTLYVIGYLFSGFGDLSITSLLTGLGETKMLMKLSVSTLLFRVPLAFILIPSFGIVGAIIGSLAAGLPSMSWGLHWIWKNYGAAVDWRSSARIFAASGIAAFVAYSSITYVSSACHVKLLVGGTLFLIVYLMAAPLVRAMEKVDIKNLRSITSDMGVISKLLSFLLSVAERVSSMRATLEV